MLSFIGLGLWDEKDITLKGLEEAKKCDKIFAEFYTSKIGVGIEKIEELIGKKIHVLSREEVENGKILLEEAKKKRVALLVPGDPMEATTHIDLRIRAIEEGIETKIFHGVSIISASASFVGLQTYKFGRVISIAKPSKGYFPLSPYENLKENFKAGLHSLLLLDIGMSANEAMEILLEMEKMKKEKVVDENSFIVVIARISSDDAIARANEIKYLIKEDFGELPHSIIFPGKLHFMEKKALIKIANAPEKIIEGERDYGATGFGSTHSGL
ncbi:MAG: diphthine synthase [Thermoplasmatales archaeon]|nr:diphthine synthase [Thermoplasmatales archaeon]